MQPDTMPWWAWLICIASFAFMGGVLWGVGKLQAWMEYGKKKGPSDEA